MDEWLLIIIIVWITLRVTHTSERLDPNEWPEGFPWGGLAM